MALVRRRLTPGPMVWGFVAQACSSATNFGLSILAGRLLGPAGLGVMFLGFTGYLLALGFQRQLITDPYVAMSAAQPGRERADATRRAFALVVLWSAGTTLLVLVVGSLVPGAVGRGLRLFVPWLAAA